MRFLPIVDRELRVSARRQSTYGLRLLAALAAGVVTVWLCSLPTPGQPPTALGRTLFSGVSIMAFAYCLLIGPFLTADCVSSEKRDGTLGLLFLTDLRSLDVVLGKWVAASLAGFYGLLAVLPALGVPLLLGGVTPGEYGRMALAVVNAIFFSLTAGMFVSALSRDQTKAILGSLILVLATSGLLPGLTALFGFGPLRVGAGGVLPATLASPIYTGQFAFELDFYAGRHADCAADLAAGTVRAGTVAPLVAAPRLDPGLAAQMEKAAGEQPNICRRGAASVAPLGILDAGRDCRDQHLLVRGGPQKESGGHAVSPPLQSGDGLHQPRLDRGDGVPVLC